MCFEDRKTISNNTDTTVLKFQANPDTKTFKHDKIIIIMSNDATIGL